MAKFELTEGCLRPMMRGAKIEEPIMQLLGCKKIPSHSEKDRYRMILSDGHNLMSYAMLHTHMHSLGPEITKHSIVQLKKYVTSVINNSSSAEKRVLIIMDLEVLQEGSEVGGTIGDPKHMTNEELLVDDNNDSTPTPSVTPVEASASDVPPAKRPATAAAVQAVRAVSATDSVMDISMTDVICPIDSLSPYQNKWVIKVLVTSKSPLKQWSNSRGSGCLFSMDLMDNSGEIRCTAFKEMAEKYHNFIQVDKTYYISKCQIKVANKQFSAIKNDYEITFSNDTVVQECNDVDETISAAPLFDFISIEQIKDAAVGAYVDIIGVCTRVSDLQEFTAKASGREMKKRDLYLIDQSNNEICLALWGRDAEEFTSADGNPVIAIRAAKVTEFMGGKNISTSGGLFKINPEMPSAYKLKGWFDTRDNDAAITNLSARTGSGGGSVDTPWVTFRDVEEMQNIGADPRGDYYQLHAAIAFMSLDKGIVYKACPSQDCNKKVNDLANGMYKCEKCNEEFPKYKYRLIPTIQFMDLTGTQWATLFHEIAEKVLQAKGDEVGEAMREHQVEKNTDPMKAILDNAYFREGLFKFRAKKENYNDEMRLKTVLVNYEPLKPEHINRLFSEVENLTGCQI